MTRNSVNLQSGCNLNAFPCNDELNLSSKVCYSGRIQELGQMQNMEELQLPDDLTDCTENNNKKRILL